MERIPEPTIELLREILDGRYIQLGGHDAPTPVARPCYCVMELRQRAMGRPWGVGNGRLVDMSLDLNDAAWATDALRTEALLPLALTRDLTPYEDLLLDRLVAAKIQEHLPYSIHILVDDEHMLSEACIYAKGLSRQGSGEAATKILQTLAAILLEAYAEVTRQDETQ